MIRLAETILSGCISKVINDSKDFSWTKIKSIISDKNNQSISTKIYREIEEAVNTVTHNEYKDSDKLYVTIEKIFTEFRDNHDDALEAVRCGLRKLGIDVSDRLCEDFLIDFYTRIQRDDDLYKIVDMVSQQKVSEQLLKIYEKLDENQKELIKNISRKDESKDRSSLTDKENIATKKVKFENDKKQDYVKNWKGKLFLHEDIEENPITLADAFIMPDYNMYASISKTVGFDDYNKLEQIIKKFVDINKTSTMLITGVPGIGKSSITSWIANEYKDDDRIVILRFRDWNKTMLDKTLIDAICKKLNCEREDLENKVLILDGFDEMKALSIRDRLLNEFFADIKDFHNFKCIITSRPAYIDSRCFSYVIILKEFDLERIKKFYRIITGEKLHDTGDIEANLEVLGIPVILYMAIMSKVDISRNSSKSELYNGIFAEEGGIFDRFNDGRVQYSQGSQILRNRENIKIYLDFLRNIAFEMFEKDDLVLLEKGCHIPNLEFQGESLSVLEFPIKNFFESTKNDIEFIHKSIYEYFVSEYIYCAINNILNEESQIEINLARVLGRLLKSNKLTLEILEFLKYKIENSGLNKRFDEVYRAFQLMLQDGMTYHTNECPKNVIDCEMMIFANMLEVIHLWDNDLLKYSGRIMDYLGYNFKYSLNFKNMYWGKVDLSDFDLRKVNFAEANLTGAYLRNTNLEGVNLEGADLTGADLQTANLRKANLRRAIIDADLSGADLAGANLKNADLIGANLTNVNFERAIIEETLFDQMQIIQLENNLNLQSASVYIEKTGSIISYEEFSKRK